MKPQILHPIDVRQFPQWGEYMRSIGWEVFKIDGNLVYGKRVPLVGLIIKIQHPCKPLDITKLDALASKEKAAMITIEPYVTGFSDNDLIKNNFYRSNLNYAPSSTILIDLRQSEDKIFSSFSENARRNIKKAKNKNMQIEIIDVSKEKDNRRFEEYFSLLKSLRKIKGFYAPGYDESKKKMMAFQKNSILVFALENNIPIAVVWYSFYRRTIVYMQTGITSRGYELLANYLLVWEGIRWAKKNKLIFFDFESIYDERYKRQNKRWKGYTEFKKRFHGEEVKYPPSYTKYYKSFLRGFELFPR